MGTLLLLLGSDVYGILLTDMTCLSCWSSVKEPALD